MAVCHVNREQQDVRIDPLYVGWYSLLIPARVEELGRYSWDMLQQHMNVHLPNLKRMLLESNIAEGIVLKGTGVKQSEHDQGVQLLVELLALLSFCPGGVEWCGVRFTSVHDDPDKTGILDLESPMEPWMTRDC